MILHLAEFIKRDSATRFLTSGFLHGSVYPKSLIKLLNIRAVSNFENSRRYSQLKEHHRWQMEKSSISKIFNISFGHLWVV